ncbi:S23 ribosomal protein [Xenococcus sp. PCC 7305]|uniref:four helix bundle protein n=1 Tax=Xenococcus sp. PCC 7305 TaxID=102125 RepID=UPI0002AD0DA5|nr:four helix bundle protein [Xenococcus sp. PCC 7305]ELS05644.1 S23 ribosomal protein [Xenococcus sp. PCC 7305]
MGNNDVSIQERSENFAIRVIKAYTEINRNNHYNDAVAVISKQFLSSGTSVGANVAEAIYAQSNKDFISKYSIALKEASESRYWIKIMIKSEIVSENKMSLLLEESERILKILTTIINKLKAKEK